MGNRLYVGNLSFHTGSDALRDTFAEFGEVTDVHLVTDRQTGQPRGFGFVTMGNSAAAQAAIAGMNGSTLDGRALRVTGRGGGDGPPTEWRIEASTSSSPDAVVVAEGGVTRAEALRAVGRSWNEKRLPNNLPSFDWESVARAMAAVRAI